MTDDSGDGRGRRSGPGIPAGLATIAAISVACLPLRGVIDPADLTMIYLAGTVFVAIRFGFLPAAIASLSGVIAFNLLFIPPYGTLSAFDPSAYLTLAIMLATSLFAALLSGRLANRMDHAESEAAGTRFLFAFARALAGAASRADIEDAVNRHAGPRFQAETELVADAGPDDEPGEDRSAISVIGPVWTVTLSQPGRPMGRLVLTRATDRPPDPGQRLDLETVGLMVSASLARIDDAAAAAGLAAERESERLRNVLLASLSHDLRTPLTVLSASAANLARMRKKLPREALEAVADLNRQIARLQKFTANLLRIAAISAGRLDLNRQAYGLPEIIGAAISRFDDVKGDRQIRTSLTGDIPLVEIDGALIEQVLVNLIENAIAHSRPDGMIRIAVGRLGEQVSVAVSDDGPGLAPGTETIIFERFRSGRAEASDRAGPANHGLGLAICRGIVEAHGGSIHASAASPPPGACFTFTLPVLREQGGEAA